MSQILTVHNPPASLERQPPTAIPPRTSSAAQQGVSSSSHKRSKSATAGPSSASKALSFLKPKRRSTHRPRNQGGEMAAPLKNGNGHGLNGHGGEHETSADGIGESLIYGPERGWSASKENIIMGPYDYLFGHPGKDIRTQLIAAFNAWLRVPEPSLKIITDVVGMLHTASLLVDDVEDSSKLRRGIPVAHSIFGTAQTINSANYVYFLALHEIQKLNNPAAITIFTAELLNLHRGQGMDLYWRDSLTCPSEDDYLEMVSNKTGGLFRLAVKLMQAESASTKNCIPLVNTISLLFQILDDYQNLSSSKYTSQKGLAEDLTEGKFSFPVIHAIRADRSSKVLLNILKQKTTDEEVKKFAVGFLEQRGSLGYTRGVLRELTGRAMGLVEELEAEDAGSGDGERSGEGIRRILESLRVESPRASVHE